jgi:hypothetical protein
VADVPAADWLHVACAGQSPVTVTVDGITLDVQPVPVADLMGILATGRLSGIIPGRLPPDQAQVWARHLMDPDTSFDIADADAVARVVTEHITGVPAETAVTLAAWLAADWLLLDGYHLRRGVDLLSLPPRRLMAVLYAFRVEHTSDKRDDTDAQLFPPRAPTAEEIERDGAAMAAALASGPMSG